ncbi:MAG: hypothetical protein EOO85_18160, partial [Pedobacter sp.]
MKQKLFLSLTIFSLSLSHAGAIERSPLLRASDGDAGHYFGVSVALSGDHGLVGAP